MWAAAICCLSVEVITHEKEPVGGVTGVEREREQDGYRPDQDLPGQVQEQGLAGCGKISDHEDPSTLLDNKETVGLADRSVHTDGSVEGEGAERGYGLVSETLRHLRHFESNVGGALQDVRRLRGNIHSKSAKEQGSYEEG